MPKRSGFVWLQGWNDLVDGHTYPSRSQPGQFVVYSELPAHFIRDVRKDLGAPKMPFVIGMLGVDGAKAGAETLEFRGNVAAVETAPSWSEELGAIDKKREKVSQMRSFLESPTRRMTPAHGKVGEKLTPHSCCQDSSVERV